MDDFRDVTDKLDTLAVGAVKALIPRASRFNVLLYPYTCRIQNEYGEQSVLGHGSLSLIKAWNYFADTKGLALVAGNYIDVAKDVHILTGGEHNHDAVINISSRFLTPFGKEAVFGSHSLGTTRIGHGVTLSQGAMIRSGVQIGNGAVIGMGAVVVKDVPDFACAAGNPATVIRQRFASEQISRINATRWWELKPSQLIRYRESINNLSAPLPSFPKESYSRHSQQFVLKMDTRSGALKLEFAGVQQAEQFTPRQALPRLLQFYYQQLHLPDDQPVYVIEDIFSMM